MTLSAAACLAAAAAQGAPGDGSHALDEGGWAFMLLSLGFVWGLAIWCFRRVLTAPKPVEPGPAARP